MLGLVQEIQISSCHTYEDQSLWAIANSFRNLVCQELRKLNFYDRRILKGDYLFKIDGEPRFIVMVDDTDCWSVSVSKKSDTSFCFSLDPDCHWNISHAQLLNVIEGSSRATILTDSKTLYKLLTGTLKAHVAFVAEKVMINGDLAAFLKMVSLLKQSGVRPKHGKSIEVAVEK